LAVAVTVVVVVATEKEDEAAAGETPRAAQALPPFESLE
jgi:hypothetical protein